MVRIRVVPTLLFGNHVVFHACGAVTEQFAELQCLPDRWQLRWHVGTSDHFNQQIEALDPAGVGLIELIHFGEQNSRMVPHELGWLPPQTEATCPICVVNKMNQWRQKSEQILVSFHVLCSRCAASIIFFSFRSGEFAIEAALHFLFACANRCH